MARAGRPFLHDPLTYELPRDVQNATERPNRWETQKRDERREKRGESQPAALAKTKEFRPIHCEDVVQEEKTMIRSLIRNVAIPILILALLGPTTIAPAAAKDSGVKVKATFELFHPAILAGKSLNPGTYSIVADETSLKISRDGKLIAEVPAQWKDAPGKAEQTSLLLDQGQIREIHFGGKTRFVVISQ